ncbi:hypothetical protein A9264_03155 [Vibrio sp. UCD-FRSSP16_10]|uniref:hypothetical protein n=1 Tax=unclassified Vibrio TaxID=2614977 RepID=UPI0007FD2C51|nr:MULTISPECIES: hypothetical protein [unclassified Vibrio]OBT12151.1 hypothetical protein A9260_04605 [Vibrio sp. UCD-FRSSP16_30]OBT20482.1 hypothetical protein A9264_03155 [Vibrio sp. UCD-FRSSP16_10]
MNKLKAILTLIIMLTSTNTYSKTLTKEEWCNRTVRTFAEMVIKYRINGMDKSEMINMVDNIEGNQEGKSTLKMLVNEAYNYNISNSDIAVVNFGNSKFDECVDILK